MSINAWLASSTKRLQDAHIATARLDCLVLLEDVTGKDRAWLLSHSEFELQGSDLEMLNTKITRRSQHIPLAYIRGHQEFYGRDFAVNEHVLVPRPETESLIDFLKTLMQELQPPASVTLADIGTGSGAIAISAILELPEARVVATDVDQNCLNVACENARSLGANVEFLHGNLLASLHDQTIENTLILLCNLPYVPTDFPINSAATHEPKLALFGGSDGLDLYRQLFEQAVNLPTKPTHILTESLPEQHDILETIAIAHSYGLLQTSDFIQVFQLRT